MAPFSLKLFVIALVFALNLCGLGMSSNCCQKKSKSKVKCNQWNKDIDKCMKSDGCNWYCSLQKVGRAKRLRFDSSIPAKGTSVSRGEPILNPSLLRKINSFSEGVDFYEHTGILTWNNAGNMDTYKFASSFIKYENNHKNDKKQSQEKHKKKSKKDKSGKNNKKKPKDKNGKNKKKKSKKSNKKQSKQKKKTSKKRLLENNDYKDYLNQTQYNMTDRRRLAVGTEALTKTRIKKIPYASVGWLSFECYWPAQRKWWVKAGVATIIRSIKQNGVYYDYVITSAHNMYHWQEEGNLAGDREWCRKYNFYAGYNKQTRITNDISTHGKPTHSADTLRRVWVLYHGDNIVDRTGQIVDPWDTTAFAFDIAVLKYERNKPHKKAIAATLPVTINALALLKKVEQMRLIGYKPQKDGKQRYVPAIVPDESHSVGIGKEWFVISPVYTEPAMSGSGLFLEQKKGKKWKVTNQIIGVHKGIDGNGHSIHTKLSATKIDFIRRIIISNWNQYAINHDFNNNSPARVGLDNDMMDDVNGLLYGDLVYGYYEQNVDDEGKQYEIVFDDYIEPDRLILKLEFLLSTTILTILAVIGCVLIGLCVVYIKFHILSKETH